MYSCQGEQFGNDHLSEGMVLSFLVSNKYVSCSSWGPKQRQAGTDYTLTGIKMSFQPLEDKNQRQQLSGRIAAGCVIKQQGGKIGHSVSSLTTTNLHVHLLGI